MRLLPVTLALALASAGMLLPAGTAAAGEVKIYRCVAADGSVAVRDSACPEGETQQVRSMTRPQDPPPPPQASAQGPQQPQQYYQPPASAYDGVSSSGGRIIRRHPVYPAPAPAQPANWGHGSWVKGSWTDSGSWTDR